MTRNHQQRLPILQCVAFCVVHIVVNWDRAELSIHIKANLWKGSNRRSGPTAMAAADVIKHPATSNAPRRRCWIFAIWGEGERHISRRRHVAESPGGRTGIGTETSLFDGHPALSDPCQSRRGSHKEIDSGLIRRALYPSKAVMMNRHNQLAIVGRILKRLILTIKQLVDSLGACLREPRPASTWATALHNGRHTLLQNLFQGAGNRPH